MDIVFNELSVKEEAVEMEVNEWLNVFLENSKNIQKITKQPASIVSCVNIKEIQFSNYSVKQWLSKQNKDNKQLFLKLSTNKPLIHDYPFYYFEKQPCKGFAYSYQNKEICTSFISDEKWNKTQITISKEYFDDKESVLEETDLKVKHFSKTEHISEIENWIISKTKGEFENELEKLDGNSLWNKRETLFPSLIFCEDTRIQIIQHSSNYDSFQQIKRKLFELEVYFSSWNGSFDKNKLLHVDRESKSRNIKFAETLSIKCPDGEYRIFDWHFRFTPNGGRGYFFSGLKFKKMFYWFYR